MTAQRMSLQSKGGIEARPAPYAIDLLGLHRAHPQRYPYLLESVAHGPQQARFDILFAAPGASFDAHPHTDFLTVLDTAWQREALPSRDISSDLPFRGGWFLYLSYELAAQIEPRVRLPAMRAQLPVARATRIPAALIRDHKQEVAYCVAEAGRADLLDMLAADVAVVGSSPPPVAPVAINCTQLEEDEPEQFLAGVRRIREYIRAGDVFQVNLARAWRAQMAGGAGYLELYEQLRCHNPAPFAGLCHLGASTVLSSSPERLLCRRGAWLETRPIAGTRPRGSLGNPQDQRLARELLAHPKERAEHVMLIDLERNDLGRVCIPGTVEVNELMALESYAHVHHIVSNVRGQARPNITPGAAIRAVFPGGTITGCPKVRCMEIIAELERSGRGAYTGAMGYLNRDGDMDLNILIRTLVVEGNHVEWRAGAGIVADSEPEAELAETRAKARGLLRALGVEGA